MKAADTETLIRKRICFVQEDSGRDEFFDHRGILREFRDRAGFHADKPIRFFGARYKLRSEWTKVDVALKEFEELLRFFLKAEEKELPELDRALDALLDDLEKEHAGSTFQREQFKAYLMIADTSTNRVAKT